MPDDFRPTATIETLKRRAQVMMRIREFFQVHEYWEVETPLLSQDTVVDAYLDPFEVDIRDENNKTNGTRLFLQTSPEFAMKRLLASGADRIFQISKAFRRGESGNQHNPEFTMLEWYAVGETYQQQMDFTESLVRSLADLDRQPFLRLTYDEAFKSTVGEPVINKSSTQLLKLAETHKLAIPESLDRDDVDGLLNLMLAELVEPQLGNQRPTFLMDYPASQAALAQVKPDGTVAERFELYIDGIEFCNGYQELTSETELLDRNQKANRLRRKDNRNSLPEHSRLLDAMAFGLPDCSGVALGIDRLMMWLLKTPSIADVIPFPFPRA